MLEKKTLLLLRQLAMSPANRVQALLFYWSIYLATIRYSLPQCFFTAKALHKAQSKSIPLIIAKSGYMRMTAYSFFFVLVSLAAVDSCGGTCDPRRRPNYVILEALALQ
jgi:hypothetical protein